MLCPVAAIHLEPHGSFPLHRLGDVRVAVQRHTDRGMVEPLLPELRILAVRRVEARDRLREALVVGARHVARL